MEAAHKLGVKYEGVNAKQETILNVQVQYLKLDRNLDTSTLETAAVSSHSAWTLIISNNYQGTILKYEVLNILEFDAHRKCMTVIVKDLSDEKIYALTKGAESSLEKNILEDDAKRNTYHYVEEFADLGLRTLGRMTSATQSFV